MKPPHHKRLAGSKMALMDHVLACDFCAPEVLPVLGRAGGTFLNTEVFNDKMD